MRKPTFCIYENKDAGQLQGYREADQPHCFHYLDSAIPLLPKPLAFSSGCTALYLSDLVRIHIVGFLTLRLILSFFHKNIHQLKTATKQTEKKTLKPKEHEIRIYDIHVFSCVRRIILFIVKHLSHIEKKSVFRVSTQVCH